MDANILTQRKLKELLRYNPDIGLFTRRTSLQGVQAGDIAGCKNPNGYIRIVISYKKYYAHRLAWFYVYGVWPKDQIDHINHNRADNRLVNLREATNQENSMNRGIERRNKSGITGVVWSKDRSKWQAQIITKGKIIHLGRFVDKFEAICARLSANNKHGFSENHGR